MTAQAGIGVTLVDQNQDILDKSLGAMRKSIERVAKKAFPNDNHVLTSP